MDSLIAEFRHAVRTDPNLQKMLVTVCLAFCVSVSIVDELAQVTDLVIAKTQGPASVILRTRAIIWAVLPWGLLMIGYAVAMSCLLGRDFDNKSKFFIQQGRLRKADEISARIVRQNEDLKRENLRLRQPCASCLVKDLDIAALQAQYDKVSKQLLLEQSRDSYEVREWKRNARRGLAYRSGFAEGRKRESKEMGIQRVQNELAQATAQRATVSTEAAELRKLLEDQISEANARLEARATEVTALTSEQDRLRAEIAVSTQETSHARAAAEAARQEAARQATAAATARSDADRANERADGAYSLLREVQDRCNVAEDQLTAASVALPPPVQSPFCEQADGHRDVGVQVVDPSDPELVARMSVLRVSNEDQDREMELAPEAPATTIIGAPEAARAAVTSGDAVIAATYEEEEEARCRPSSGTERLVEVEGSRWSFATNELPPGEREMAEAGANVLLKAAGMAGEDTDDDDDDDASSISSLDPPSPGTNARLAHEREAALGAAPADECTEEAAVEEGVSAETSGVDLDDSRAPTPAGPPDTPPGDELEEAMTGAPADACTEAAAVETGDSAETSGVDLDDSRAPTPAGPPDTPPGATMAPMWEDEEVVTTSAATASDDDFCISPGPPLEYYVEQDRLSRQEWQQREESGENWGFEGSQPASGAVSPGGDGGESPCRLDDSDPCENPSPEETLEVMRAIMDIPAKDLEPQVLSQPADDGPSRADVE